MTSLKIIRLPYAPLCFLAFFSTALSLQLLSACLALWQRDWTALTGGAFFGLLAGCGAAALTLVFVCAFNLLAPLCGGLTIGCEEDATESPETQQ